MPYVVSVDRGKCLRCDSHACTELIDCPAREEESACIGCGACVLACPFQARKLVEKSRAREVSIGIDGRSFRVPERITAREALVLTGHQNAILPGESGLSTACGIGSCWSCVVQIDGVVKPACTVGVGEGMAITTELPQDYMPRRGVVFLSGRASIPQIEAVCFTVGCNFLCPQCHNWFITWNGKAEALTPKDAALRATWGRERIGVNRTLITGGECTLNRPWLVQYLRELRRISSVPGTRFIVDTNGSLLTHDYIDEIVEAGATDISIDLKGLKTDTFMRVTGLQDTVLAEKYNETAWEAVRYLTHSCTGRVTLSISIPYNREFILPNELNQMGMQLFKIDPSIDVGVVAYKGAFRKKNMLPPRFNEMKKAYGILQGVGLKNASAQTVDGFIQPSGAFVPARGPF